MKWTPKKQKKPSRLSMRRARKIRLELRNSPRKKNGPIVIRTYNSPCIDDIVDECANKLSNLNPYNPDSPSPIKLCELENKNIENESKCENTDKKKKDSNSYRPSILKISSYFKMTNMIDEHDRKRSWKKVSWSNKVEYINSTDKVDTNNMETHSSNKQRIDSGTHLPSNLKPSPRGND